MLKVFRQSGIAVKILLWVIVAMIGGAMVITMVPGLTNQAHLTDSAGNLALMKYFLNSRHQLLK